MRIPSQVTLTATVVAACLAVEALLIEGLPEEYRDYLRLVLRLLVGVFAIRNLFLNPSGESCKNEYDPDKNKNNVKD